MLEKIGLPPKPSLRGNTWVVDASHCQGCSAQFTFINRKHHCRRCGGIFCGSCTQQRMVLRGQGDSPVRICEPCKKLEEAARFEIRQGRRAGRGSLKSVSKDEDEVLNQILGQKKDDKIPSRQRSAGVASSSSTSNYDDGDIQSIISNDKPNILGVDLGSTTPDELRQQAMEEKKKYKILKGDGKPEEALKAFKRGKELERQADALEVHLRKTRKKILTSGNLADVHDRGVPVESDGKTKPLPHVGREKDDLTSELRELGWSDVDLHNEDKKPLNLSLEGELSSMIGEIFAKPGKEKGSRIDKTQVVALKKNAVMLKREGKLVEAKEELKKAKILEKELEEQELLADAEDSDDELSALIRGMDDDKEFSNVHDHGHDFDFDHLLTNSDDFAGNFEVTDEDMMDPEIAAALESFGWTELENKSSKSQALDKEALHTEIQSLKKEALNQKRAGKTEEATAFLKKAKLLEGSFNSSGPEDDNTMSQKSTGVRESVTSEFSGNGSDSIQLDGRSTRNRNVTNSDASTAAPKSRLMIQRELLSLKKKALTLRREGKMNEAEEEMQKGAVLERQLMEMDKASNLKTSQMNTSDNVQHTGHKHVNINRNLPDGEGGEDDVTDQDMSDTTYLSILKDLGWNDDSHELSNSPNKPSKNDVPVNDTSLSKHSTNTLVKAPRRSKVEIQRELLGLKRKALALRREGKAEDADEVLNTAKTLEAEMAEMDAPKNEAWVEPTMMKNKLLNPPVDEEREVVVSEEDMHDPALNSLLTSLGWKDHESEPVTIKEEPIKEATSKSTALRSKGEIQRELLALKRNALALRRKGEIEEAEEILRKAKILEAQIEDFGSLNKDSSLDVSSSASYTSHTLDLLTGDSCNSSEISTQKQEECKLGSANSSLAGPVIHLDSPVNFSQDQGYKNNDKFPKSREVVDATEKPNIIESNPVQDHASQQHLSLRQEILAHKRKAVSLKKEGKLTEAKEELRQAKLLEKGLEDGSMQQPDIASSNNVSHASNNVQKKQELPSLRAKPLTSRDRFKLQQESLGHKREALKLRKDGRVEEAEVEFERAKAIEAQLEELAAHDSSKSDAVHDVTVEDFLDPQLLSALKAVGIESSSVVSKSPEKQDTPKTSAKVESSNQERIQLEERIKEEKLKAINLKRSGKQAEALDALRHAKLYEKKLNSLTSG
ncbi:hypothetical protein RJT34_04290 [Clitoria ternatea]|uniref:FYVE-type domain-containing protein n=1 Tax=Clitoria ternatea TaxID=43366 RepID=A0AAN9KNT0_CLITE